MSKISIHKVVNNLPATLQPNDLYLVLKGTSFDMYMTNGVGTPTPFPLNLSTSCPTHTPLSEPTLTGVGEGEITQVLLIRHDKYWRENELCEKKEVHQFQYRIRNTVFAGDGDYYVQVPRPAGWDREIEMIGSLKNTPAPKTYGQHFAEWSGTGRLFYRETQARPSQLVELLEFRVRYIMSSPNISAPTTIIVPDIEESTNSVTNPNLATGWNEYLFHTPGLDGDLELTFQIDAETDPSTQGRFTLTPTNQATMGISWQFTSSGLARMRYRAGAVWTDWTDVTSSIRDIKITRINGNVEIYDNGTLVDSGSGNTGTLHINVDLYAQPNNIWSDGTHIIKDIVLKQL